MAERYMTPVRLSVEGRTVIQEYADKECGGNRSEMIRVLLSEAISARKAKEKR